MNDNDVNEACAKRIEELQSAVDELVRHNWDLKTLILRYGDDKLRDRLDKLMKKYSVTSSESNAA